MIKIQLIKENNNECVKCKNFGETHEHTYICGLLGYTIEKERIHNSCNLFKSKKKKEFLENKQ